MSESPSRELTTEHRLTVRGICPVSGMADAYNCLIRLHGVVAVETILAVVDEVTQQPSFQEDITRNLAHQLGAATKERVGVETHGIHSGVYTTCRCSA